MLGKIVRRVLGGAAIVVAAAGLAVSAWAWREYRRDPMLLIDRGVVPLRVISTREEPLTTQTGEDRRLLLIRLSGVEPSPLRIAVSLPAGPAPRRLPVLLILGGLEIGRESLRYVGVHGRNALVAVEYPRSSTYWYEGPPLLKLPSIREAALAMPQQVASLIEWVRQQPWADPERVTLLGYSFGAFFVPACARVAAAHGLALRTLVMAYGGADVPAVLDANLRIRPRVLEWATSRILAAVVRPLEPALHLPHLGTDALFVTGLRDTKVPLASARLMQSLKPAPKAVIDLDSTHMGPDKPELTAEIVRRSREWLISKGAMNP